MQIKHNNIIVGSLVTITALSTAILTLPSALADDGFVDVVTVTVPVSCSLGASGMNTHTASIQNGVTTENIGTTNIKVTCNDNTGYALYAIGYTNNEYGNNKLTSATLDSTYDILTSTSTSNTSSWAMKLTKTTNDYTPIISGSLDDNNKQTGDPDFSDYSAVPNEYTKVAYALSSTDMGANASGSNLTTTYRAYVSQTQPAGTYIGQVKYILVHPSTEGAPEIPVDPLNQADCPAGYVCYAPNASDILGSMDSISEEKIISSPTAGKKSVGTDATTINLIAPNYAREGYGFAGWSTDFTATNASIIYGPNETITTVDLLANENITFSSQGLILYPVWVASAGDLQGWTGCSDPNLTQATYDSTNHKMVATLSSVTALTDTRDDNVYAVAKLADGKCWMIENLRLADTHNDNGNIVTTNITTSNTNNPLNTNGTVNFKIDYANNTIADHLAPTSDTWCSDYDQPSCLNQTMLNTNNTNMALNSTYGYGNYYNWYSATAGNGTYSIGAGNVLGDLCPTGWHLPYGKVSNTIGSFYYLNELMANDVSTRGSKDWRSFPNNFVFSGHWFGASPSDLNSDGSYWSSSAYFTGAAYRLNLKWSSVAPGSGVMNKASGLSVRCVAQ